MGFRCKRIVFCWCVGLEFLEKWDCKVGVWCFVWLKGVLGGSGGSRCSSSFLCGCCFCVVSYFGSSFGREVGGVGVYIFLWIFGVFVDLYVKLLR